MNTSYRSLCRGALMSLTISVLTTCCLASSRAQDIAAMNNRTLEAYSKGSFAEALAASVAAVDAARKKGAIDFAFGAALGNEAELLRMADRTNEAAQFFE